MFSKLALADVATAPDACADPDAGDANDENDYEYYPLPVVGDPGEPRVSESRKGWRMMGAAYQSPLDACD